MVKGKFENGEGEAFDISECEFIMAFGMDFKGESFNVQNAALGEASMSEIANGAAAASVRGIFEVAKKKRSKIKACAYVLVFAEHVQKYAERLVKEELTEEESS